MTRRTPLELDQFLPYRLSVLSNVVSSAIAQGYAQRFGITIPEWRVIAVLGASPGLSAAEVAARTAMDKVAVSRAVSSLLASRKLTRSLARDDRRRSALRLTTAGLQVYAEVAPLALDYERRLLATLTRADRAALDRVLDRLLERAQALRSTA
jgi:DNA-binding MarR family transcriptional regulator